MGTVLLVLGSWTKRTVPDGTSFLFKVFHHFIVIAGNMREVAILAALDLPVPFIDYSIISRTGKVIERAKAKKAVHVTFDIVARIVLTFFVCKKLT